MTFQSPYELPILHLEMAILATARHCRRSEKSAMLQVALSPTFRVAGSSRVRPQLSVVRVLSTPAGDWPDLNSTLCCHHHAFKPSGSALERCSTEFPYFYNCIAWPKAGWTRGVPWQDLIAPDRGDYDSWTPEMWSWALGDPMNGRQRQPQLYDLLDLSGRRVGSLFYHFHGLSCDVPSSSKEQLMAAMPYWDELSSEAAQCFQLGDAEIDTPGWRSGSHQWLNHLYKHLNPPLETYTTPSGDNQWFVRKLPYNLFQSFIVLINILLESADHEHTDDDLPQSVDHGPVDCNETATFQESVIDSTNSGGNDRRHTCTTKKRIPRGSYRSPGAKCLFMTTG